jgi:hypothetical protein
MRARFSSFFVVAARASDSSAKGRKRLIASGYQMTIDGQRASGVQRLFRLRRIQKSGKLREMRQNFTFGALLYDVSRDTPPSLKSAQGWRFLKVTPAQERGLRDTAFLETR